MIYYFTPLRVDFDGKTTANAKSMWSKMVYNDLEKDLIRLIYNKFIRVGISKDITDWLIFHTKFSYVHPNVIIDELETRI